MSHYLTISLMFTLGLVSGCSSAVQSSEVAASYTSSVTYQNVSCQNLALEYERTDRVISQLSSSVDRDFQREKNMALFAWVLFWPAAFAMDGNQAQAAQLSDAKGQQEAIRSAMLAKNCSV